MARNVLVFAEIRDGHMRNVTLEALAAARKIGEGGEVAAAVFGAKAAGHLDVLARRGADRVYVVDGDLEPYRTESCTQAACRVVELASPDVMLMGHTGIGKDLAPRLAARLDIGLVSDVTDVAVEGGEVIFSRPIYAGKALQKRKFAEGPIFATIRPNNIPMNEPDPAKKAERIDVSADNKELGTVVKEVVRKTAGGVDLSEARIVVSGGRGVRSAEGFKPLRELAEVLGAAVGASRGACDAGYCDYAMQIGQTGKVVTPDLYIACGISGAIQHVAGMSNSEVIVAINKGPGGADFQHRRLRDCRRPV